MKKLRTNGANVYGGAYRGLYGGWYGGSGGKELTEVVGVENVHSLLLLRSCLILNFISVHLFPAVLLQFFFAGFSRPKQCPYPSLEKQELSSTSKGVRNTSLMNL